MLIAGMQVMKTTNKFDIRFDIIIACCYCINFYSLGVSL
jgi:hypothetical protein